MTSDMSHLGSNAESSPALLMATHHPANANDCDETTRNSDELSWKAREKEEQLEILSGKIYKAYQLIRSTRIDARDWPISRTDPASFDLVDKDCSRMKYRGDRLDPALTEWFTLQKRYWMLCANQDNWANASVSLPPLTKLPDDQPHRVIRKTAEASNREPPSTLETGSTLNDATFSKSSYPSAIPSSTGHSHIDLQQSMAVCPVHERRLSFDSSAPSAIPPGASAGRRYNRLIQHASSLDSMRGSTDILARPKGEKTYGITSGFRKKLKMGSSSWLSRSRKNT